MNFWTKHYRKKRITKFTILELLIVISIIIILMALLLPGLKSAKETAKQISCLNKLKQLGMGMSYYANDNNSWLPRYPSDATARDCWDTRIKDYVGYVPFPKVGGMYSGSSSIFHCPSSRELVAADCTDCRSRGYAMSINIATDTYGNGRLYTPYKYNSSVMILGEIWQSASTNREYALLGFCGNGEYLSYSSSPERFAWRHRGRMNFIRKDISGDASKAGASSYGENIVWLIRTDGLYYKDGSWYD